MSHNFLHICINIYLALDLLYVWYLAFSAIEYLLKEKKYYHHDKLNEIWRGQNHKSKNLGGHGPLVPPPMTLPATVLRGPVWQKSSGPARLASKFNLCIIRKNTTYNEKKLWTSTFLEYELLALELLNNRTAAMLEYNRNTLRIEQFYVMSFSVHARFTVAMLVYYNQSIDLIDYVPLFD